jgi:hypothetical protein
LELYLSVDAADPGQPPLPPVPESHTTAPIRQEKRTSYIAECTRSSPARWIWTQRSLVILIQWDVPLPTLRCLNLPFFQLLTLKLVTTNLYSHANLRQGKTPQSPTEQLMPSKKPRTEKQIAASRANGARSKGPKTASGLLAESVLFDVENKVEFDAIMAGLIAEHNRQSATERILVENMAVARWQQLRNWAMQKSAMNQETARLDSSIGGQRSPRRRRSSRTRLLLRTAPALRDRRRPPARRTGVPVLTRSNNEVRRFRFALVTGEFHRSLSRLLKLQDRRTEGAQVPEKKICGTIPGNC